MKPPEMAMIEKMLTRYPLIRTMAVVRARTGPSAMPMKVMNDPVEGCACM